MGLGLRGAALEYLGRLYGGLLREQQSTVTVGTSAVALVGNDAERVAVIFTNLSANDVYVTPDTAPTSTRGVRIAPGGTLSFSVTEDGTLTIPNWFAVASAAASVVHVIEVRRETLLPQNV